MSDRPHSCALPSISSDWGAVNATGAPHRKAQWRAFKNEKPGHRRPAFPFLGVGLVGLSIVFRDPLRDRLLKRRAFVLALQFPKCLGAHMRDVWLFSFSLAVVTRHVDVAPQVPSGAVFFLKKNPLDAFGFFAFDVRGFRVRS
jgi:hypothetical protein